MKNLNNGYGEIHQSQRGYFAFELFNQMSRNDNIWLLVGDLGYRVFDKHMVAFPDRFLNCGSSEQAMMDIAIGMSYEGKIPVVYSITPFLLYRPFESLRTYINHEKLNIKLIGSGRDKDYSHDGISHWADDAKAVLHALPEIRTFWPEDKNDVLSMVKTMFKNKGPYFLSLRR